MAVLLYHYRCPLISIFYELGAMMFIRRKMTEELKKLAKQFPVIALYGPRQSGKTTLSKMAFEDYKYVNLEKIAERRFAEEDPEAFLEGLKDEKGVILDEVQNVPDLLSYIQAYVDENEKPGFFILTGSQNLLLNEKVSQTLAGRVAILTLMPFSVGELLEESMLSKDYMEAVFKGSYPRVIARNYSPLKWYPSYIDTYIERDVRQIKNLANLSQFRQFLELCAGRIGQLLKVSSLANDCGVTVNTANSWLSILEASYIIFMIRPHCKNFNKRIIKSPKLYFYDTGVACSLLGIKSEKELLSHYLRGGLFESFIISEFMKYEFNRGEHPRIYFWRDKVGHEVDCIIEDIDKLIPIEIKAGKTINANFFDGLKYWNELSGLDPQNGFLIYGGDEIQKRSVANVLSWRLLTKVFGK